jgi:Zn-dependent protease
LLNFSVSQIISRLIVLLTSFSIHEFAHAWTADRLGDDTPRLYGRLTLNPAAHLDVVGSLMLLVAGFGWAKPVPINPYALRRRSAAGVMWVSLAGPMSNLLMAVLAALPFRLNLISPVYIEGKFLPTPSQFLWEFISINLVLMIFNLIPLAPLDGEKVLIHFLPPNLAESFEKIRPYGPMILLFLLFVAPIVGIDIIGWIIYPPIHFLASLLIG